MLSFVAFPALALTFVAQALPPESPGPIPAGWKDIQFTDPATGSVNKARIYYPALSSGSGTTPDPSLGPYPLVGFLHGFGGSASYYDKLSSHLASYGFLVASIDNGPVPTALECQNLLHWVDAQSHDPNHWLSNMAWDGDWAAVGHSMGGDALGSLVNGEPRVRTIIGLQAWDGSQSSTQIGSFTGTAVWIAGTDDSTCPPSFSKTWYTLCQNAERNFYFEVIGMGHLGCTDFPSPFDPMAPSEQIRVHKRIVTPILRAEMLGEDEQYEWVVGQGLSYGEPWTRVQLCASPILWGGFQPTALGIEMGVLGLPSNTCFYAGSLSTGSSSTPFGNSGLNLNQGGKLGSLQLNSNGYSAWSQLLDPRFSGRTVFAQAAVFSGTPSGLIGSLSKVLTVQIP